MYRTDLLLIRNKASFIDGSAPTPGMKLHEYQNKGLTEKAFRKLLILRDAILVALGSSTAGNDGLLDRKAGAISRTPCGVIYRIKYIKGRGKVKEKLQENSRRTEADVAE